MAGERFEEARGMIDAFLKEWPGAEFGPAHIILSDDNLEDHWFGGIMSDLWCIIDGRPQEARQAYLWDDRPVDETKATMTFLGRLLAIPEDARCPEDGIEGE